MSPNNVPISLKGIRLRTKLHELHLDNNKICFLLADANLTEKTKSNPQRKIQFCAHLNTHQHNNFTKKKN